MGGGTHARKLFPFAGGRFVLEEYYIIYSGDYGFRIYDIETDAEVYATPERMQFAGIHPDGHRIYVDMGPMIIDFQYERGESADKTTEKAEKERLRWKTLQHELAPKKKAEEVHEFTEEEMKPKGRDILGRKIVVEEGEGFVRVKADLWFNEQNPFIVEEPIIREAFRAIQDELKGKGRFVVYPFGHVPAIQLYIEAPDFETCKRLLNKYRTAIKKTGHLKEGW